MKSDLTVMFLLPLDLWENHRWTSNHHRVHRVPSISTKKLLVCFSHLLHRSWHFVPLRFETSHILIFFLEKRLKAANSLIQDGEKVVSLECYYDLKARLSFVCLFLSPPRRNNTSVNQIFFFKCQKPIKRFKSLRHDLISTRSFRGITLIGTLLWSTRRLAPNCCWALSDRVNLIG